MALRDSGIFSSLPMGNEVILNIFSDIGVIITVLLSVVIFTSRVVGVTPLTRAPEKAENIRIPAPIRKPRAGNLIYLDFINL
jgi:hypothetical protein